MNIFTSTTKHVGLLTVALTLAFAANIAYGQWADPTGTPPSNNAETPLNVSGDYQAKLGDLGAIRVRSDQYCDAAGANCFVPTTSGPSGGGDVVVVAGRCYAPLDNILVDGTERNIIHEVPCNPVSCEIRLVSRVHDDYDDRTITAEQTTASGLVAIYYWQHVDDNPPGEHGSGQTYRLASDSWGGSWTDESERAYTYFANDDKQSEYGDELQSEENESNEYTGYEPFSLSAGTFVELDGWDSPYHTYVSAEVLSCTPL